MYPYIDVFRCQQKIFEIHSSTSSCPPPSFENVFRPLHVVVDLIITEDLEDQMEFCKGGTYPSSNVALSWCHNSFLTIQLPSMLLSRTHHAYRSLPCGLGEYPSWHRDPNHHYYTFPSEQPHTLDARNCPRHPARCHYYKFLQSQSLPCRSKNSFRQLMI